MHTITGYIEGGADRKTKRAVQLINRSGGNLERQPITGGPITRNFPALTRSGRTQELANKIRGAARSQVAEWQDPHRGLLGGLPPVRPMPKGVRLSEFGI